MHRKSLVAALFLAAAAGADAGVTIAKGATQPQLAEDRDGAFYCVFLKDGNVQLSVSTDAGKTWSRPVVAIDAKGQARGGAQRGPRIGVDDKKNIVVTAPLCFDDAELKNKYPAAELWLATSSDGGKTFSRPLQVNDSPKTASESLHQLAVAPSGEIHVVWLDSRDAGMNSLWYAKVEGGKAGKNVKISAGPVCGCCAPGISVDGKGNPFVAFRDGKSDTSREIYFVSSRDGGKSFSAPVRVNQKDSRVPG